MNRIKLIIVTLALMLGIFLIPSSVLNATFETDTRDIYWLKTFAESDPSDLGGVFQDVIQDTSGNIVVVGSHTTFHDPSDLSLNAYDGVIAKYDLQGNLLKSVDIQGPVGSKTVLYSVKEMSGGNYVAVGFSHWGSIEGTGKVVVLDNNLNILAQHDYYPQSSDYDYANFRDVEIVNGKIAIAGTIATDDTPSALAPTYIVTDSSLSSFEEMSTTYLENGTVLDAEIEHLLNLNSSINLGITNILGLSEQKYNLVEYNTSTASSSVVPTDAPLYSGYAIDAAQDASGTIYILVANNDNTYSVKRYDQNLTELSDMNVDLTQGYYNSITITEDGLLIAVGEDFDGNLHYAISDGTETSVHSYDTSAYFNATVAVGDDNIVSVGARKQDLQVLVTLTTSINEVSFDGNGVTLNIPTQTLKGGEIVVEPDVPTRDGYTFEGWYTDPTGTQAYDFTTAVNESFTLYAKWTQIPTVVEHTVTFDTLGGSVVSSQTVIDGDLAVEPATPTYDGYTFAGWYLDKDLSTSFDFTTPVTEDMTLYAKWDKVPSVVYHTVRFETNGALAIADQSIESGKLVTKPSNPIKDGYTFEAWYVDEDLTVLYDFNEPVTQDLILYARWSVVKSEVKPEPKPDTLPNTGIANQSMLLAEGMMLVGVGLLMTKKRNKKS